MPCFEGEDHYIRERHRRLGSEKNDRKGFAVDQGGIQVARAMNRSVAEGWCTPGFLRSVTVQVVCIPKKVILWFSYADVFRRCSADRR